MKLIKVNNTYKYKNSDNCIADIYELEDKTIDVSTARIVGDYPLGAWCVNEKVKEIIYIISGKGTLEFENKTIQFKKGDAILIDLEEKYCWRKCRCKVLMSCAPAWYPEQHKIVEH